MFAILRSPGYSEIIPATGSAAQLAGARKGSEAGLQFS